MNVPVGSECFIPSINTKMAVFIGGNLFLPERHEMSAVLESSTSGICPITRPKPPNPVLLSTIVTYKKVILLVLIEVCELVEFAFYHIKKLPRIHAFALCDLRDLEQSLLAKVVKMASVVVLLRRVRHRGDSERKVKRAVLVIDESLQSVSA